LAARVLFQGGQKMSAQEHNNSLEGIEAGSNGDLLGLQEAFRVFSKASETLKQSYADLQLETRRLSAELAAANAELQRAQRLQAMGEMAVQLAHEIRNPLGSIELFASMLSRKLQDRAEMKGWADQIVSGVTFLNTIVTNMLTFTKVSRPQFSVFDLNRMIDETVLFFDPVCRQRSVCVTRQDLSQPIIIEGDIDMLRQMLTNLLMNGMQAMHEKGVIHIVASLQGHDRIRIDIEDNGIGIPEENLPRIFDPFFTTNEKGTGLGLSLVNQIVQKHNGTITAQSRFGQGTRFHIELPAVQGGEETAC
jgi:two-component system sensor histidine kinase FlrB